MASFVSVMLLLLVGTFAGCKDDEILLPSAPFNLTRISFHRNISPTPGTTLSPNQQVAVTGDVSFALAPAEAAVRDSFNIFIGFYGYVTADSGDWVGTYPAQEIPLTANAGTGRISASVTVPANLVEMAIQTNFIHKRTGVFLRVDGNLVADVRFWIVQ
jgi:hypothetical protein